MMDTQENAFLETLSRLYTEGKSSNPLQKIKDKAWDHFSLLKLPSKKSEAFRYVPLRRLFERSYEIKKETAVLPKNFLDAGLPECHDSLIVLLNGKYSKELSNVQGLPSRIVVSSLKEAAGSYSSFLTNHFAKTIKEEKDPFAALNAAFQDEGVFIYLPPKTVLEKPIQVLHLIDSFEKPLLTNPRLQVFAGASSKLNLIASQKVLSGSHHFINYAADFAIEEDAILNYTQLIEHETSDLFQTDATRAFLKKNSSFTVFAVTNGSKMIRTDYKMVLAGENAEACLNGLWMLEDSDEFHTHVLIDHQAPFCRSRQLFKGVLNDFSRSSFEGKILVQRPAQKTDAFQLNSNLLLSDHVNAYSKPNLEIFADDVKASHGATFGQLNEEQLFCLKSRGIAEREAKKLLVSGFCKEITDLIQVPSIQNILGKKN